MSCGQSTLRTRKYAKLLPPSTKTWDVSKRSFSRTRRDNSGKNHIFGERNASLVCSLLYVKCHPTDLQHPAGLYDQGAATWSRNEGGVWATRPPASLSSFTRHSWLIWLSEADNNAGNLPFASSLVRSIKIEADFALFSTFSRSTLLLSSYLVLMPLFHCLVKSTSDSIRPWEFPSTRALKD